MPGTGKNLLEEARKLKIMWQKLAKRANKDLTCALPFRHELRLHRFFIERGYDFVDVRNRDLRAYALQVASYLSLPLDTIQERLRSHRRYFPLAAPELFGAEGSTDTDYCAGYSDEDKCVDRAPSGDDRDSDPKPAKYIYEERKVH